MKLASGRQIGEMWAHMQTLKATAHHMRHAVERNVRKIESIDFYDWSRGMEHTGLKTTADDMWLEVYSKKDRKT